MNCLRICYPHEEYLCFSAVVCANQNSGLVDPLTCFLNEKEIVIGWCDEYLQNTHAWFSHKLPHKTVTSSIDLNWHSIRLNSTNWQSMSRSGLATIPLQLLFSVAARWISAPSAEPIKWIELIHHVSCCIIIYRVLIRLFIELRLRNLVSRPKEVISSHYHRYWIIRNSLNL